MIQKLEIEGYRCFEKLTVDGLGRLNLIVGQNNSGKTSLLEAIRLLTAQRSHIELQDILVHRGELFHSRQDRIPVFNISNLFFGRVLQSESKISIQSTDTASIVEGIELFTEAPSLALASGGIDPDDSLDPVLTIRSTKGQKALHFNFETDWGTTLKPRPNGQTVGFGIASTTKRSYVPSSSLTIDQLQSMWEALKLNGESESVMEVMYEFDPEIQDLDFLATIGDGSGHVKLKGLQQRVPLRTLGDGASRVFALAIAAASSRGDALLIDEIDTALHYTTMSRVWKMLFKFAEESNTQIFATTHSQDCVDAFANLVRDGIATSQKLSLQRVVKGEPKTISYSGDILLAAVKHEFEVR